MRNIASYVRQRADVPFSKAPLCEADCLAFAILSYADLNGCVPTSDTDNSVTVSEAHEVYSRRSHPHDRYTCNGELLLREMADSERYGRLRMSRFHSELNTETSTQFAAVQIGLENNCAYISYRGTDNSLAGWKEDFMMAHEITRSQQIAADYLRAAVRPGTRYILGGHSKGGNHASYAALNCTSEQQNQIIAILCFDSPGLCPDLISEEDAAFLRSISIRLMPGFSIVGTLFQNGDPAILIESDAKGVWQHDPYSWHIDGDSLRRIPRMEKECEIAAATLAHWINSTTMQQRRVFIKDFFASLQASGAGTLSELLNSGISGFSAFVRSFSRSEAGTRKVVVKLAEALFQTLTAPQFSLFSAASLKSKSSNSATLRIPARKKTSA